MLNRGLEALLAVQILLPETGELHIVVVVGIEGAGDAAGIAEEQARSFDWDRWDQ
jgi:hypothetical protein